MTRTKVSRETSERRIAVVGTGTGVGKTHVAVALVACLARRRIGVVGLKPIESGLDEGVLSDADRLAAVSTVVTNAAPYRFGPAVSPHLAARRAGVTISVAEAAAWVGRPLAEVVIVETAGAVLSPLGPGVTNLDLVRALAPSGVVVVGVDRLGVLHEISACLLVLRALAPELGAPVVVLNAPERPDGSTGTNAEELAALGIVTGVVVLGRADALDLGDGAAQVLARLGV